MQLQKSKDEQYLHHNISISRKELKTKNSRSASCIAKNGNL